MKSRILTKRKNFNGLLAMFFLLPTGPLLRAYEIDTQPQVSSRKPVNITAVQLIFDRIRGYTFFKKNVKATHENVTLTSDEIRAINENREATADGHVHVVDPAMSMALTCGNLEYLNLMNSMTAHDHPLLTSVDQNGKPISIQGRQMELDSEKKTVVVHQDVKIIHDDGHAEAQKATYLAKDDKLILEESPKLFTDNGVLSGRRIVSGLGKNPSVIVEGMADAVFNPDGKPITGLNEKKNSDATKGKAEGGKGGDTSPTSPLSNGNNSSSQTASPTPVLSPVKGGT
jgi:lipopolysaccharide export system protein LptA